MFGKLTLPFGEMARSYAGNRVFLCRLQTRNKYRGSQIELTTKDTKDTKVRISGFPDRGALARFTADARGETEEFRSDLCFLRVLRGEIPSQEAGRRRAR